MKLPYKNSLVINMSQHEKMDNRASEGFAFGGLMLINKLRCKNRNFNCRQTKNA